MTFTKRRVAVIAAAAILALVWTLLATEVMNKVDEVLPTGSEAPSQIGAAQAAPIPPILVDPFMFGIKAKKKFKAGKIGNARGDRIPGEFKRALRRYWNRKNLRRVKWWADGTLRRVECAYSLGPHIPGSALHKQTFCMALGNRKKVRRVTRQVTRIKVVCGGSAAIGWRAGGPVVGLGFGAAACLYDKGASKLMDVLP